MQFASSKDGKKSILYLKPFSNLFFFVVFLAEDKTNYTNLVQKRQTVKEWG